MGSAGGSGSRRLSTLHPLAPCVQKKRARRTSGPLSPRFVPSGLQLGTAKGEVHTCAGIRADTAETDVKAATTAEVIVAAVSLEFIVVALASESVGSSTPRNLVLAVATEDAIAASTGKDLITPAARTDQVVAATALNLISATACNDDVATGGSPKLVGARRSRDGGREASACRRPGSGWRCGGRKRHSRCGYRDDHHSDLRAASRSSSRRHRASSVLFGIRSTPTTLPRVGNVNQPL